MPENPGGLICSTIATGVPAGGMVTLHGAKHVFQVAGETSAGAGASTGKIQVAINVPDFDATSGDDNGYWVDAGNYSLTLSTTVTNDYLVIDAGWKYARLLVSTISGTDATIRFYKSSASY